MTQKYAPIIRYDWDCRKMKKDEWRRYERRIYEQAVVFTRSTGTRILIVDNGPQGSRRLSENDNWSEYHITLERQPASATASNHANHCRCGKGTETQSNPQTL